MYYVIDKSILGKKINARNEKHIIFSSLSLMDVLDHVAAIGGNAVAAQKAFLSRECVGVFETAKLTT